MSKIIGGIAYVAALGTGLYAHRVLCRVVGFARWPGTAGWIGGQAIAGAAAGLVAALPVYLALIHLDADPALLESTRINVAIVGASGIGLLMGTGYALTRERQDLLDELAADERLRVFGRAKPGNMDAFAREYLAIVDDQNRAEEALRYQPGQPSAPARRQLAARRAGLEGLLAHPLSADVKGLVVAAIEREKAREREGGDLDPDAA